ncbi:hypothetical protein F4819DRAFT_473511 [Hypoxylon fuscum]|nr:hypothetical protein F4819DRAFT_473511 [Hypoxylon fuscum]
MSGAQIISAFEYMYANDGVKICGSAYLSNGCHVSADGCPNKQNTYLRVFRFLTAFSQLEFSFYIHRSSSPESV